MGREIVKYEKQESVALPKIPLSKMTVEEKKAVGMLGEMLRYKRPAYSKTTQKFINRFILSVKGMKQDAKGNCYIDIGEEPKILWSSHTDTVHNTEGKQEIVYVEETDTIELLNSKGSNCLGADCTTGVWLMLAMIKAKVPGRYIFHAAEELGGHGATYLLKNQPELLKDINFAVAFDRKGTDNIITHQFGGRCSSDEFCNSLGKILPPGFNKLEHGTFTDTAIYADVIPECTNISVGYYNQHTSKEVQNVSHAIILMRRLTSLSNDDINSLVVKRDPSDVSNKYDYGYGNYYGYGNDNHRYRQGNYRRVYKRNEAYYEYMENKKDPMYNLVYENPREVADLLKFTGYTVEDLEFIIETQKQENHPEEEYDPSDYSDWGGI